MKRRLLPGLLGRDERSSFVVAQKDPEKFADVYETYYEVVLAFFARETWDPDTAFDLMAETFTAAFADLDKLRGRTEDEGRAWLWVIARHKLYDWRRAGVVDRRCRERLGIELPPLSAAEYARTEELAELDGRREHIRESLALLADDQAQAIRLRIIDERPYGEIADMLGISQETVRARVSRGLRRLRSLEVRSETIQ